jgi:hypothetical protein
MNYCSFKTLFVNKSCVFVSLFRYSFP